MRHGAARERRCSRCAAASTPPRSVEGTWVSDDEADGRPARVVRRRARLRHGRDRRFALRARTRAATNAAKTAQCDVLRWRRRRRRTAMDSCTAALRAHRSVDRGARASPHVRAGRLPVVLGQGQSICRRWSRPARSALRKPKPACCRSAPPRRSCSATSGSTSRQRNGGRINFGYWLIDGEFLGIEGEYFALQQANTTFNAGRRTSATATRTPSSWPGRLSTSIPSLPTPTRRLLADRAFRIFRSATPAARWTAAINIRTTSNLQSANATLRRLIWIDFTMQRRLDLLLGYRFLRLDDSVTINDTSTFTGGVLPTTTFTGQDQFSSVNQFHGGEIGLKMPVLSRPLLSSRAWPSAPSATITRERHDQRLQHDDRQRPDDHRRGRTVGAAHQHRPATAATCSPCCPRPTPTCGSTSAATCG